MPRHSLDTQQHNGGWRRCKTASSSARQHSQLALLSAVECFIQFADRSRKTIRHVSGYCGWQQEKAKECKPTLRDRQMQDVNCLVVSNYMHVQLRHRCIAVERETTRPPSQPALTRVYHGIVDRGSNPASCLEMPSVCICHFCKESEVFLERTWTRETLRSTSAALGNRPDT